MVDAKKRFTRVQDISAEERRDLATRFAGAQPCKYVVIDNVLSDAGAAAVADFPAFDWGQWHRFKDDYQVEKVTYADLDGMPKPFDEVFWELNGPAFVTFLEDVTGIKSLISDPYLKGGGLHCTGPGGTLTPHTDFHRYHELGLNRRLNVLIYLNRDWSDADGGSLQFFADADAQHEAVRVVPELGRMVIFQTDHHSVHGFTDPVAPDHHRRSLATYYYTSEETADFSGDLTTYWRRHGESQSAKERAGFLAYKGLLRGSQAFAIAAHRFNPNLQPGKDRSTR